MVDEEGVKTIYGGNTQKRHELETGFAIKKNIWDMSVHFEAINV